MPKLIALFLTLAVLPAFPKQGELFFPSDLNFSYFDHDPNQVTVEDPGTIVYTELPSGDYQLKTYRATEAVIKAYSDYFNVVGGEIKDYAKAPNCTRAEIDALKKWTTNDIYQDVQFTLRVIEKGKVKGETLPTWKEHQILLIASGANCAPRYEGPVVRMENTPGLIMEQYQPGKYILARAFTSTTKGSKPSQYFLDHAKQMILIPHAVGADIDVLGITPWPEEKEVLLPPTSVFKVTSRKDNPSGSKPLNLFGFNHIN